MRLRAFEIGDYRNLQHIHLQFPAEITPPIFMLAGVNGTGKTGILRMLAHILTALEYGQVPFIRFQLEYDIHRGNALNRITIRGDGSGAASGIQFLVSQDGATPSPRERGEWKEFLPERTIVYTSGSLIEWLPIFDETSEDRERQEHDHAEALRAKIEKRETIDEVSDETRWQETNLSEITFSRTMLISPTRLQLALLATLALEEAYDADLRKNIFQRAQLDHLTHFALQLKPLAARTSEAQLREQIQAQLREILGNRLEEDQELKRRVDELGQWHPPILPDAPMRRVRDLAEPARIHRNPDGSYHLLFEMNPDTRARLADSDKGFPDPLQFYEFLVDLQNRGVLTRVDLVLKKTDLPDPILDRHLSDGEYEFLGRMALFLLLGKPESLFLLDEPETHFNDVWKRELVDILASVIGDKLSTVLLTTHSSIVLSDAFREQIILLTKDELGRARREELIAPTKGADPSEIMVNVLRAPDSIPGYTLRELDRLLEREWKREDRAELEQWIRRLGPGYHRSELRTIWRRLNAP